MLIYMTYVWAAPRVAEAGRSAAVSGARRMRREPQPTMAESCVRTRPDGHAVLVVAGGAP